MKYILEIVYSSGQSIYFGLYDTREQAWELGNELRNVRNSRVVGWRVHELQTIDYNPGG